MKRCLAGQERASDQSSSLTACAFATDRTYIGDRHGRVHIWTSSDTAKGVIETFGAPVQCLLVADLVNCGGPSGVVVGDANGAVSYFHDGRLLCEHTLPLTITAMARHCDEIDRPAVAVADASGVVLLFGAHEVIWRVRLQDARPLRACTPSAVALASHVANDSAGDGRRVLLVATGGRTMAALASNDGALLALWNAPASVSALCSAEDDGGIRTDGLNGSDDDRTAALSGGETRLLLAASGELYEDRSADGSSLRRFCCVGAHVTSMSPLLTRRDGVRESFLLIVCCGHFNGSFVASRCGLLRHILPVSDACAWPLAARIECTEEEPDDGLDAAQRRARRARAGREPRIRVTIGSGGGEIASLVEELALFAAPL